MFHSVSSQDFSRDLLIDEVGDVVLALGTQMVTRNNFCCLSGGQRKATRSWDIDFPPNRKIDRIGARPRDGMFLRGTPQSRVFYDNVEPLRSHGELLFRLCLVSGRKGTILTIPGRGTVEEA